MKCRRRECTRHKAYECRLSKDCRQGIPRSNDFSRYYPKGSVQPSEKCRRCGKDQHWANECRSTRDKQGNSLLALVSNLSCPFQDNSGEIPQQNH